MYDFVNVMTNILCQENFVRKKKEEEKLEPN